jgi:hypothetical protein
LGTESLLETFYPNNFDPNIHNAQDYEVFSPAVEIDECLVTHLIGEGSKS